MEPTVPNKKLEPGVYQGSPDDLLAKKAAPVQIIRTMKSDAAEAIKNQNETVVSIAIAEEKKKAAARAEEAAKNQTQPENTTPAPKRVGRFVIILIILLLAVLLALGYVYLLPRLSLVELPKISLPSFPSLSRPSDTTTATTTPVVSLAPSLLTAQTEKRFDITNQSLEQVVLEIKSEISLPLPLGNIENLYFFDSSSGAPVTISANRLFIYAGISAPEILARSLEKNFMAGLFGETGSESTPFLILKVSGNDTGLAGMLEWEALLPRSFSAIFGTNEGVITTTPKFRDILVEGKDARFFTSSSGIDLAYAFANQNTIVIAGSQTALETLLPIAAKI